MSESTVLSAVVNATSHPETPQSQLPTGGGTALVADPAIPSPEVADPAPVEQPSAEQSAAPTSSLALANKTLTAFGTACRDAADANYRLAGLGAEYVRQFLAASDKAQRSTAVDNLAEEWRLWDEESMAEPVATARKRLRERVNCLLRVNAVAQLLGDGRGVAKGDGTGKGRGRGGKDKPLAWGILREFSPLVERAGDERVESWRVVQGVEEEARALVAEVATSGLKRPDVVAAVAKLMLAVAEQELAAARAALGAAPADADAKRRVQQAEAAFAKWGGKVTPPAAPPGETPATLATTPPAPTTAPAAAPPTTPPATPPAPEGSKEGTKEGTITGNILTAASKATPLTLAESLADQLVHNDAPDDVLERLMALLSANRELCRRSRSACKRALLIIRSTDTRHDAEEGDRTGLSPVDVASRLANAGNASELLNGTPAPSAA